MAWVKPISFQVYAVASMDMYSIDVEIEKNKEDFFCLWKSCCCCCYDDDDTRKAETYLSYLIYVRWSIQGSLSIFQPHKSHSIFNFLSSLHSVSVSALTMMPLWERFWGIFIGSSFSSKFPLCGESKPRSMIFKNSPEFYIRCPSAGL